jgi:transposase
MAWRRGRSYSQDLRDRVFTASDAGMAVGLIASTLMVSIAYVSKALSRRRQTGETSARPQRCHVPPKLAGFHGQIEEQIAARPDITLEELKHWLVTEHQVPASVSLLSKTLRQLNLTLKKRPSTRRNRSAPMSPRPAWTGGKANPRSIRES